MPLTGFTNRKIKHHTEQLALVVVRDAALRTPIVTIAFKPGVKARLFGRLRKMSRATLQFCNLLAEPGEILLFVQQTSAQLNGTFRGAGYTFAEPQRARVILSGVIHGFERLRTDAFDIPQMKEFMSRYASQRVQRLFFRVRIEFDRR